jgi:acylphosphatase
MKVRHYLVTGHVQGVSFRAFAEHNANSLGIVGWVRNLTDGRVEIFAAGSDEAMTKFEKLINRGPQLARVDRVEKQAVVAKPELLGFEIRRTQEAPWPEKP